MVKNKTQRDHPQLSECYIQIFFHKLWWVCFQNGADITPSKSVRNLVTENNNFLTENDPQKELFPSNRFPASVPHAGRHSSFSKLQVLVSHVNPGGFRSAEDQQDSSGFKKKLHAAAETKKPTFSASHNSASRATCTVVKWGSIPTEVLYRSEPLSHIIAKTGRDNQLVNGAASSDHTLAKYL